jgi:hypothetical protein
MAWRGLETDLTLDPAATDVLAAYEAAWKARKSTAECYRAGFGRGARLTPDQKPTYAAQRAVAVILAAKVSLRIRTSEATPRRSAASPGAAADSAAGQDHGDAWRAAAPPLRGSAGTGHRGQRRRAACP